jgi:hypothetical protein
MTISIRPAIIFGGVLAGVLAGVLGGVYFVDTALGASTVQIHPTTVTPKVTTVAPKVTAPKVNVTKTGPTTTTTTNTVNASTSSTSKMTKSETSLDKSATSKPYYPQGVRYNTTPDGKTTVTIDGRTMPLNKNSEALAKEAESPPPKKWQGNQLVPITDGKE